jgi:PAS domain S-box-containing protein
MHKKMTNSGRVLMLTAIAVYCIAVFTVDVLTPLGIEVWMLNVPVILVPVLFRSRRAVVIAGLACSALVAVGSFLSPPGQNPLSWDILNRGMGLIVMWLIVAMTIYIVNSSNQLDNVISTLAQSEDRMRLAVEGANMGTYDVNLQSRKVVCSATHLRLLGYHAVAEVEYPMDIWKEWVHSDDRARIQEARENAIHNRSFYSVEYRINRTGNGGVVWLAVFGRCYYNDAGEPIRFVGVSFDITRRKELEREVHRKELEHEILEITDRQQRHIGQELHDSVGQELTGMGLFAKTLSQRLLEASSEQRIATRLVTGLDEIHQHIRALARGLLPVEVESNGLWAALDDMAAKASEQTGVPVKFECPDWVELPDHATSMQLFRIAQEAVSNALRHGRPQTIRVTILSQPNGLRLRVRDDGVGILDQADKSKGLGIRIMEYRAESIKGEIQIKPAEEGGTVVTVTVPRRKANDHEENGDTVKLDKNLDRG